MEKRGIKKISRIHSKYDNTLIEKTFTKIKESYEYTKRKLDLKDEQIIKGQFIIYYFKEKQNAYCLDYNKNESLEIIIKNEKADKYDDIKIKCFHFFITYTF